jgi:hypothetical protein
MSVLSVLGAGLFAAGFGAGWWLCRDREARRAERLGAELEEARREYAGYRQQVEKHFAQTSDLFRDLTHQYTALYAHLAEGTRDLCSSQVPALGRGFDLPALERGPRPSQHAGQPGEPEPSESLEAAGGNVSVEER